MGGTHWASSPPLCWLWLPFVPAWKEGRGRNSSQGPQRLRHGEMAQRGRWSHGICCVIDTAASSLHKESIKRGFVETISHVQFRANTHKILEKGKGKEGKGRVPLSFGICFFWQTVLQTSLVTRVAMKRADVKWMLGGISGRQIFDLLNLNYYYLLLIKCGWRPRCWTILVLGAA